VADPIQVRVRLEPPINVAVSPTNHVGLVAPTQDLYRVTVAVAEKGAKGDTGATGPQGQTGQPGAAGSDLANLGDVQLSSLTQGDLISYNESINKWTNTKQSFVTDGGNF
jgi:hypothetical protein